MYIHVHRCVCFYFEKLVMNAVNRHIILQRGAAQRTKPSIPYIASVFSRHMKSSLANNFDRLLVVCGEVLYYSFCSIKEQFASPPLNLLRVVVICFCFLKIHRSNSVCFSFLIHLVFCTFISS